MVIYRQWFEPNHGSADSLPVVLLHEGLGSVSAWGPFPQQLADATNRRVFAFDRRGYGRSEPHPGPWPPEFMTLEAERLASLLRSEGIDDHLLVGHSDGATIALLYPSVRSTGDPEPAGIVSISAHVFVEQICIDAIETVRDTYLHGGDRSLAARLAPHHDDPDAAFDAWSDVWTSLRFRDWDVTSELGAVRCPVLAMQGTRDVYATRAQLERIAEGVAGPVELLDVEGSDHWPHREATELVLSAVAQFLERMTRR